MRILLTGATGFIGAHLGKALNVNHDILGIAGKNPRSPGFPVRRANLTDQKTIHELFKEFPADIIIHSAALSRILECEAYPEKAEEINVTATKSLTEEAASRDAKLIFFSSDMVFSGQKGNYTEQDSPSPINTYGRTKLRAEQIVLNVNPQNLVIRLNSVVGASCGFGASFSERILSDVREQGKVQLFADQFRSPIHVRSVVSIVTQLITQNIVGVFHLGGAQRLSRTELGRALCKATGISEDAVAENSYRSHQHAALFPPDNSFGVGRREIDMPELQVRTVEKEFAEDNRRTG
ncbi:SDR family oxidoreductase [bacterium]|nr:SDR family oxidoreductase [bacterium]